MIKTIALIFMCCFGLVNSSYSQNEVDKAFLQNQISKEQVYLHINSSFLFSGEKLFYKFYNLNADSKTLSDLSKIGWVVLINSNKEEVFKHKLNLKAGQAHSDFFIPSSLASGTYKILGYTSWMLNAENYYFEQDIYILNPYQNANQRLTLTDSIEAAVQGDRTQTSNEFSISLNKTSFSKREEVVLSFDNAEEIRGDFSISVRRIDNLVKPDRIKSTEVSKLYKNKSWDFSDTLILPEVRGSYFKGRIQGVDEEIFKTSNLMLSFAGEESEVRIISLDDRGEFNFTLTNRVAVDEVLVQLTGYRGDFSVELYKDKHPDYSELDFVKQPVVQTSLKQYVLEKSINNQIENAYSAVKADLINLPDDKAYFFDDKLVTYDLDDYTRFPEVSETFVEIIKSGRIEKNKDNTYSIFVRNLEGNWKFDLPALLIVDGVVLKDHTKLISFGTEKIQSIGLLTSKIFYGPEMFQGVVTIQTKTGDFPEELRDTQIKSAKITIPQDPKQYYSPDYGKENLDRIPDYRYQLWWNPELRFKGEDSLKFFTSDLSGKFEIEVEGFTQSGKPVSLRQVFIVE
ncbi:hypothetical protein G3567_11280 [Psychroflexus sp. YR1-1]|uniref:MG2 domain-containing protein n=1 Tax=Psychroflexus aurantiacus TaxID=2709310 RepID=A0A6B3R247_9FLAO|nr:hypothetical protein [Psychroflexus aurantiacus]NEV94726.1 hypothetical protein [Psychroflexus aurantiacus]